MDRSTAYSKCCDGHVDVTVANTFTVGIQRLLATACGLLIASLYYAQPLTELIAESLGTNKSVRSVRKPRVFVAGVGTTTIGRSGLTTLTTGP